MKDTLEDFWTDLFLKLSRQPAVQGRLKVKKQTLKLIAYDLKQIERTWEGYHYGYDAVMMPNLSSQSYSVFVQESDYTNTKTTLNQKDFVTLETLTLNGHLGFARECTMSEPVYHCKIIFLSTPSDLLIHIEALTAKVVHIFFSTLH